MPDLDVMNQGMTLIANLLGLKTPSLWWLLAITWVWFIYNGFRFNGSASDTYFNKWFSYSFIKTYKRVFVFIAFFAWLGGTADNLAIYYSRYASSTYIGELIGTLLGLVLLSFLLSYLVRLSIPLLKWIHNKTQ